MLGAVTEAKAQGGVELAIARASATTGVDFSYLMNQARVESAFNPGAHARTSSAAGLYQFVDQSWLGVVAQHGDAHGLGWAKAAITRGSDGRYRVADPQTHAAVLQLRKDPEAAAAMAAEYARDNGHVLGQRLGRQPDPVDLYLAHFLGAGGATKFIRHHGTDPDRPAADLFPAAARANHAIFFAKDGTTRSLGEVRARFAQRLAGSGTPPSSRPAGVQFATAAAPALHASGQVRLAYLMLASLGV